MKKACEKDRKLKTREYDKYENQKKLVQFYKSTNFNIKIT